MRRAATLMRDRAGAATGGPWFAVAAGVEGFGNVVQDRHILHNDAEHIASWDPVMARVAADLLESAAAEFDRRAAKYGADFVSDANPTAHALIELARTYLHEEC